MKIKRALLAKIISDFFDGDPRFDPIALADYINTETEKEGQFNDEVIDIINYFNKVTGKFFKPDPRTKASEMVRARLREGFTVDDCMKVIKNKMKDEYFIENPRYMKPTTLFRPSHFEDYLNEDVDIGGKRIR
jgi:uncharacterized phage protein (TIGR02220 family)